MKSIQKLLKSEIDCACSYFIGALLSANESYIEGDSKFWLAPICHNYQQLTDQDLAEHKFYISELAAQAGGTLIEKEPLVKRKWFPSNKVGFAVVFESEISFSYEELLIAAKTNIISKNNKRAFLVGAFDGRFSPDINKNTNVIRNFALDCDNDNFALYLETIAKEFNIEVMPLNQARDRLHGGNPRDNQFRISRKAVPEFMSAVGLISPYKFKQIKIALNSSLYPHNNSDILFGLKTLQEVQEKNIGNFASLDFEMRNVEDSLDAELRDDLSEESLPTTTNFTYFGVPKPKSENTSTAKRTVYKRSKVVAINALVLAKHQCEISPSHLSFIRKKSAVQYMEPHHLIPLGYENLFDVSLDVEENVICLCSNCHNHLHYGKNIEPLLKKLYDERKELLAAVGINITFEDLIKMYN